MCENDGAFKNDHTIEVDTDKYLKLCEDSRLLSALKTIGVDNWEGYQSALVLMEKINDRN